MKAKCTIIGLAILLSLELYAQDIVSLKNGSFISCKIEEMGETDLKYKKGSTSNEVLRTISKKEIFKIVYSNKQEEFINESFKNVYIQQQQEILREHEKAMTSGKGISALKSISYKLVIHDQSDGSKDVSTMYFIHDFGQRMDRLNTKAANTREMAWAMEGDSTDGFKLVKEIKDEPGRGFNVSRVERSYLLLDHDESEQVTYLGKGEIGVQMVYLFMVYKDGKSDYFWLDNNSFLPVEYSWLGLTLTLVSSKKVNGFWFPTQKKVSPQSTNDFSMMSTSDIRINEALTEYFDVPDIDRINAGLDNQREVSIVDFLKFNIDDHPSQVIDFLDKNKIKYAPTEIKDYRGTYTYLLIGKGKFNKVSVKEAGDQEYDFIDFCFLNNKLQTIRFAKYDVWPLLSGTKAAEEMLGNYWKRCKLQDKMILDFNKRKPTSELYWSRGKDLLKEKKYPLNATGMKAALISTKKVEDSKQNLVLCQELFLGMVNDPTYRDLEYVQ